MKTSLFLFSLATLLALGCQTDNRQETANQNSDTTEVNTQQETPQKLIDYLVGEWAVDSASASGQEGESQRIVFTHEARYIVYSGQQKIDSGAYRMNEQLTNLYLESELNEEPREYEMSTDGNTMTMKPKEAASSAGAATVTYRKIGPGSSPGQ